jgi:intersectin
VNDIHIATVLYNYEATCAGELTIEQGETIQIVSMETGNKQWWEGQGKKGKGQFPCNYVVLIDQTTNSPITSPTITGTPIKVKALYDYEPTSPGDLGFKEGDIVTIHSTIDKDWWDGELNGQQGVVPANYVEIVS